MCFEKRAIFSDTMNPILPKDMKKSPKISTAIVLLLTVIGFFLLHVKQQPINTLLPSEVKSSTIFVVAGLCRLPLK